MLLALALAATAQDLTVYSDEAGPIDIIAAPAEATDDQLFFRGMGAPTILHDGTQFVLYFETQLQPAAFDLLGVDVSACGNARVWGIGRATSPDGLDWTVDSNLILEPRGAGHFDACVIAQPEVLFDGETYHLWYKAEQERTPCPEGEDPSPFGCEPGTGVGYAWSTDGINWTGSDTPAIALSGSFGYPRVTQIEEQYIMVTSVIPSIDLYTADDPAGPWTLSESSPIVQPGLASWMQAEVVRPTLLCDEDRDINGDPEYGYTMWVEGRDTVENPTYSLGRMFSTDGDIWAVGTDSPYIAWDSTTGDDWRAMDAIRTESGAEILFYSRRDLSQTPVRRRIGVAWTSEGSDWSAETFLNNTCGIVEPIDTSDPGTDDPGTEDPGTGVDTDTADTGEFVGGGCKCDGTGAPSSALGLSGLLFGLLAVRRRR